ncbi:MAG: carboxypeptidase-like regulatory domain-containing protein [Acidobacteriota bacterium]|nr:carboxypeptidase-like regulatory domain-containing protein [Acidobacteriota bacterium]
MRASVSTVALAVAAAALVVIGTPTRAQAGQADQGRFSGRITDSSGAALPGATVTITSARLSKPVTVVADGVGQYVTPPLQPGVYAVTFEMPGFEPRVSPTVVLRGAEVFILDRQLDLAALTETVTVTGAAPPPPPEAAPEEPRRPLRSRPQIVPVPKPALASVCGPAIPEEANIALGHIVTHRDDPRRELYGNGDVLVLDVGADMGMTAGENFVVRRRFRYGDKGAPLKQATYGQYTAGLIQVVEATPATSVAVVVYVCGEVMAGDAIEAFDPLPVVAAQAGGEPKFDDPARVVFGAFGQQMGAPRQLMVIDRGGSQGVERGQRLTIFRRSNDELAPVVRVGEGVVVVARPQSATIRIDRASEAVEVGDLIALHR